MVTSETNNSEITAVHRLEGEEGASAASLPGGSQVRALSFGAVELFGWGWQNITRILVPRESTSVIITDIFLTFCVFEGRLPDGGFKSRPTRSGGFRAARMHDTQTEQIAGLSTAISSSHMWETTITAH